MVLVWCNRYFQLFKKFIINEGARNSRKTFIYGIATICFVLLIWKYGINNNHEKKNGIAVKVEDKIISLPEYFKAAGAYPFNRILIEPAPLPDKLLFLVIVSSSSLTLKNRKRRDAIRKTWGNCASLKNALDIKQLPVRRNKRTDMEYAGCRVLFYTGKTGNAALDVEMEYEASTHKDILSVDSIENYKNITWKLRAALKYVSRFNIKYLIKSDDDVYINLPRLGEYLISTKSLPKTIYGGHTYSGIVVRDPMHKHYVSMLDFPETHYPMFCKGSMVVLSGDALSPLVLALSHVKPFNIDDAYLGISLNKIGVLPLRLKKIVQFQHLPVFLDYLHVCDFTWLIGIGDGLDAPKMFSVHEAMLRGDKLPIWMCWHFSWYYFLFCLSLFIIGILGFRHVFSFR